MFESHSKLVTYRSFKIVADPTYNAQTSVFDKFGMRLENTICSHLTDGTFNDKLMSTVQNWKCKNQSWRKKKYKTEDSEKPGHTNTRWGRKQMNSPKSKVKRRLKNSRANEQYKHVYAEKGKARQRQEVESKIWHMRIGFQHKRMKSVEQWPWHFVPLVIQIWWPRHGR